MVSFRFVKKLLKNNMDDPKRWLKDIRTLTTNPDNLSSILGIYMVEEIN